MKTPDYLNYDRYKKNRKKDTSKNSVVIGMTTFFIALLLFTVVAKSLSPDVDVTIGNNSETDAKESGLGVKKFIDERLKMIQLDDNSAGVSLKDNHQKSPGYDDASFNRYSIEQETQEEQINLPTQKDKKKKSGDDEIVDEPIPLSTSLNNPTVNTPPRPTSKDLSTPIVTPKMSKVFVGRYSTLEQAKVAQGILLDSGVSITPFVKDMGSYYTLQVGSYSSRAKADGLAAELQRNNFPAKVVQD